MSKKNGYLIVGFCLLVGFSIISFVGTSVKTQVLDTDDPDFENPLPTPTSQTESPDMFTEINEKALVAQNGQTQAIGELVDTILVNNGVGELEPTSHASLKDRIVRAQVGGNQISEQQFANAVNWLADELSAPAYAKTTQLQARTLRINLNNYMPNLFVEADVPGKIMTPSTQMSVCEAVCLLSSTLQQKMFNPFFQKNPTEWDAEFNNILQSGGQVQSYNSIPANPEMKQAIYGANLSLSEIDQLIHRTLDQLNIPR
jgi:hypothetical protein